MRHGNEKALLRHSLGTAGSLADIEAQGPAGENRETYADPPPLFTLYMAKPDL